MSAAEEVPETEQPAPDVPPWMRTAGMVLREVFIITLMVLAVHVSMPQNETIWTAYDTPNDLVRLLLGAGVCCFLGVQLFKLPRDKAGYRTWLYLGLCAVPFALICLFATW